MTEVRAKALLFLAGAHAMGQELADMEECLRQAGALVPAGRFITALGWGRLPRRVRPVRGTCQGR